MSTSIRHNEQHQRRNKRVNEPVLHVAINGRRYRTVDWSLGGMLLTDFHGIHHRGQMVELEYLVPFVDADARIPLGIYARVVRSDEKRQHLALAFAGLHDRAFEIFESLQLQRRLPRRYREALTSGAVETAAPVAVTKNRAAS